jgi:acyl-CoA synthetase (AMP-forming)/AMP-acid ligase II
VSARDARTIPALLADAVAAFPDAEYVVSLDERVTFAEVDRASRAVARSLVAAGIGKGNRVGAQFSYGADWVVTWLAVSRIGAVHVPLSTAYKPAELRKVARHADLALLLSPGTLFGADRRDHLEDAFPSLAGQTAGRLRLGEAPFLRGIWVTGGDGRAWATPLDLRGGEGAPHDVDDELLDLMASEVTPADTALTIYTSGTTAEPKGVVHTHGALTGKAWSMVETKGYRAGDRIFCGMPFFWVGGLVQGVLPGLAIGATLLCLERPEAGPALELMEREQATQLIGWPGVTGPILADPTARTRGIPAMAKAGGKKAGLGMTETLAGYSSSSGLDDADVPPDQRGASMGRVIPGMEVRIVDPETGEEVGDDVSGAILVRGWCLMQGIHKHEREETFTPDGWYDTGDKGYLLDGILFFEGRYKEMIKTSGNNVAPPEVEAVLQSFPEVAEAHVLGVPDAQRGELVAAAVVPAPGRVVDVEELRERARAELSNYKVPRRIVVVERGELPSLANGKPDRLAIRALLAAATD